MSLWLKKFQPIESKEDYVTEFVTYASPTFVCKEALPETQRGRFILRHLLVRAILDRATELQIKPYAPYKSACLIMITPDGESEITHPVFMDVFHHIQGLATSPLHLNLDEMINEFLAEAYASNRLGNDYVDSLRAMKIKNFTLSIEIDSAAPKATLKLKALD